MICTGRLDELVNCNSQIIQQARLADTGVWILAHTAPFKRTVRPFEGGNYRAKDGSHSYVRMPSYSADPRSYIRGFLTLQRDIRNFFEFVHPAEENLGTHSDHIGILLTRACFEIETNFIAILTENGYYNSSNLTMKDYRKIELSHKMSEYEILISDWHKIPFKTKPFQNWKTENSLPWYNSYNKYKHDKVANFEEASFGNLINAWCGLCALLSAQFYLEEFSPDLDTIGFSNTPIADQFEHGIGGYLQVKFPTSWMEQEKYDFTITNENFHCTQFAVKFPYNK